MFNIIMFIVLALLLGNASPQPTADLKCPPGYVLAWAYQDGSIRKAWDGTYPKPKPVCQKDEGRDPKAPSSPDNPPPPPPPPPPGPPPPDDDGKPGWGHGDPNHEHEGPPGQCKKGNC